MAHTAKSRASDGPQYHNIEEVELQHLRGEYLSSLHTGSDAQGSYASLSVHTARSSTARLHDHDRFLEDGISTTTTSQYGKDDVDAAQSKQSPSSWMRTLATPFAPLQRGHTHVSNRMKTSRYHGWRMGVILGCFMSFTVLCINIALLIVGAVSHGGYKGGVADLIYGDDITVERWNTGIHVFINILGTCLLSASNYAMQVISSPTREEIDRVHAAGGWLAVGLLSPRNWRKIARKRVRLALALGLSSVPLHMFYNSITFRVLTESTYEQRAISIDSEEYGSIAANVSYTGVAVNTTYANLTNGQWKSDFAHLQSMAYLELILVFDDVKYANESLNDAVPWQKNFDLSIENVYENGGSHTRARTLADMMSPSDWIGQSKYVRDEFEMHIVHAFARYASSRSRIQLSVHFLAVVIAANVFKLAVMVGMLLMDHGHSKYIVTLGDAASSFLANPDPCTEGKCLLEDEKLYAQAEHSTAKPKVDIESTTSMIDASALPVSNGRGWHKRTLGYYALIRDEQARFTAVAVFLMMAVIIGFIISNNGSGWGWATASDGALSFSSNSRSTSATLFNAWLANMPQVLLSFCYMNLNSFCTAMTSAKEWNNLAFARKGLRVSEPCGQQRSTYFLQLPYRWAMPLIVISTTLHWLLSQTFFLVRIDTFNSEGDLVTPSKNADSATDSGTRSACGVSNSAFVVFFVMFFGLCIGIRVTASRRFVTGLPQAASNSLVISAACHPSVDDVEPHLKAVQWGVVEREMVNGFEHCTLSSEAVRAPEEGEVYH